MTRAHALIIDDDPQNLEVLERLLSADDVSVTRVQDTSSVEETLINLRHVDVVFLDLEMPKQDGYEIFAVIRNSLGSAIPIIACTVHSNEITTAHELGFDGFIAKPLRPKLFSSQLSQILNGTPVWDAS